MVWPWVDSDPSVAMLIQHGALGKSLPEHRLIIYILFSKGMRADLEIYVHPGWVKVKVSQKPNRRNRAEKDNFTSTQQGKNFDHKAIHLTGKIRSPWLRLTNTLCNLWKRAFFKITRKI